jgi:hypothetical protein
MKQPARHRAFWNTAEILRMQREYELLEMPVTDIAKVHGRSINSIVNKLVSENVIDRWENARGYADAELIRQAIADGDLVLDSCMDSCSSSNDDSDEDDDDDAKETLVEENIRLQDRVTQLENIIANMKKGTMRSLRSF